ncbi:hypothetical protein EVAR_87488_1 [Eumeta japonica]|uniref:Uncharacterized protein n=1 Tax=Eumeta variegata TaxID=151549 RepID=A0A4C1VXM4_EUMVA|nr:hypothetical protein EVAR_87488_1 [Eumeta japonica]
MSDTTFGNWFRHVKNNDFEFEDKECSGAPKKFEDEKLEELLDQNRCQTLTDLRKTFRMGNPGGNLVFTIRAPYSFYIFAPPSLQFVDLFGAQTAVTRSFSANFLKRYFIIIALPKVYILFLLGSSQSRSHANPSVPMTMAGRGTIYCLAAAVAVSLVEDGSSSSPPQAPLITQPLSDSDDPQHNPFKAANIKSRHYCQIGNFESDSFNENFSPTRPANARRKRKYKKMPVDYVDGTRASPPVEILSITTERKIKVPHKMHSAHALRNPLQFEDSNSGMDCIGNESSSLSSSDSDGVVTNDSDREGDDELTDWPGIEELKVFNKSLTFKSSKSVNNTATKSVSTMPPPKRLKKEKLLVKSGWASCKNRLKKRPKVEHGSQEDDNMMSDSKTIVDVDDDSKDSIILPHSNLTSFSDVKNAGVSGQNANESFFQSFQAFQEKSKSGEFSQTPRTNFTLQKTSSSDLNLSEKSPQSDHYFSEHSMGNNSNINEVREIRAGCRRIRDERPSFLILSAANEQLSKFLQDSCQTELKLPCLNDPNENDKLESLAKLYSLELKIEMGRPVLRKTSNTTQAIRVEHSYPNFPSDHKRRCYGDDGDSSFSDQGSGHSISELDINEDLKVESSELGDNFSSSLVEKSLLDPGEID